MGLSGFRSRARCQFSSSSALYSSDLSRSPKSSGIRPWLNAEPKGSSFRIPCLRQKSELDSPSHSALIEEAVQIGAILIVWPLLNGVKEVNVGAEGTPACSAKRRA